jgi:hypothetical protein
MKRFLIAAILSFVFCFGALAQQSDNTPATKEDIQRYFEVMHSHDMMKQMAEAMSKPMHQMVHEQFIKDKDKLPADFEERMNKMMDGMFKDMPWDEMLDAMAPAYQKHFTKGDVDALCAFYSSPTGQKLLREMPAMMAESMQSMMPIMQKYMEKIQDRLQQQTAEMLKQSEKKPGAASPTVKN